MLKIVSKYNLCINTLFLFRGEGDVSRQFVIESLARFSSSGMKRCVSPMNGKIKKVPMLFPSCAGNKSY